MNIKKITEFINIENNKLVFVIILVGVSFMLFSGMGDSKKDSNKKMEVWEYTPVKEEEKLRKILSGIKGVGEVDVLITYYSGIKSDIAYETRSENTLREGGDDINRENSNDKKAVMSGGEPFVIKSVYPEIKGVLIVCDGAGDVIIQEKITKAVSTAMGIAQHRVCVAEKK